MANVYVRSGASGANNGTSKTDAYTTLAAAMTAGSAGDVFYVASDHAETQASAMTLNSPGTVTSWCRAICVDFAGSTPPVAADIRSTATVSTTGGNAITLNGYCYIVGIQFQSGDGSSTASIVLGSNESGLTLQGCVLYLRGTGSSAITLGDSGAASRWVDMIDTKLNFSSVNQFISPRNCRARWRGTASALSGVAPTNLIKTSSRMGTFDLEGVDLSAMGSGKTIVGANTDPCRITMKGCRFDSAVTVASTPSAPGAGELVLVNCDGGATNYNRQKYSCAGTHTVETTVIRTGGASNGVTGYSEKLTTTANAQIYSPFEGLPFAVYNSTTGSAVTVTVYGVWNSANLPNNNEFWIEASALTTSGYPLETITSSGLATLLTTASALTASTQAWDGLVTARANSTAYSVGDVRKVASNSGRIFFCTTAGTSAASEPAGYASAVDGGSVTDGTAVFRAAQRFKTSVNVTPTLAGPVYIYPRAAVASATLYICSEAVLS